MGLEIFPHRWPHRLRLERLTVGSRTAHRASTQAFFEYPRCIGHELCVTVMTVPEGVPNPQGVKPGDVCAVEPYLHCGR